MENKEREVRVNRVVVFLSDEEEEKVSKAAAYCGLTPTTLMRYLAIEYANKHVLSQGGGK